MVETGRGRQLQRTVATLREKAVDAAVMAAQPLGINPMLSLSPSLPCFSTFLLRILGTWNVIDGCVSHPCDVCLFWFFRFLNHMILVAYLVKLIFKIAKLT